MDKPIINPMKIKIIKDTGLIDGLSFKELDFKSSKSFVVIKKGKIVQFILEDELQDIPKNRIVDLDKSKPIDFTPTKLDKEIYFTRHKYSKYIIQIDKSGYEFNKYFADLSCCQYYRILYQKGETLINKSNIHTWIFGTIGAILAILTIIKVILEITNPDKKTP
jgi:hypothetical protein